MPFGFLCVLFGYCGSALFPPRPGRLYINIALEQFDELLVTPAHHAKERQAGKGSASDPDRRDWCEHFYLALDC